MGSETPALGQLWGLHATCGCKFKAGAAVLQETAAPMESGSFGPHRNEVQELCSYGSCSQACRQRAFENPQQKL